MRYVGAGGNYYSVISTYPYIASAGYDKSIRIWNADNGDLERILIGHEHIIKALVVWNYSKKNQILVSCGWDHQILTWNLIDGSRLLKLSGHTNRVRSMAITNTAHPILVSGGDDRIVKAWDLHSGNELLTLNMLSNVSSVAVIDSADNSGIGK